ncbi:4'-phosphopantetheinyl transferase family protein [Actinospica robiniae]|uniref:4'-phosphopantetheinyl transferase family protein n=1 Tax=Actinospica robiniae TaxID=304901 RepID=UPI0004103078|nr:4'-phosphopantetheinyl transferase superfamily protein [Actinospica robiniae]
MTREDEVTVFLVHTDQSKAVTDRLARHLDARESQRAEAIRDHSGRSRFVVAHGAMREIVAERLSVRPAEIRWHEGPNGKPSLESELRVNLSTGGAAALVALTWHRDVGVDIEPLPSELVATRLASRHFPAAQACYVAEGPTPDEIAARFTTLWSRKEACVKAHGGRLSQGMALAVDGVTPICLPFPADAEDGVVRVHDLPAPPGHRAAVALTGAAPFDVFHRVWDPETEAGTDG